MSEKKPYLPKVRTSYHPTENEIKSYAPNGDSTPLPNPTVDSIAVNNIAGQEFDYTESLVEEGTNILSDDSDNHHELNLAPGKK
ncbi:hypothetical protein [Clostridium sp. LP20]|uniref:hypothetical protein n=1 Tax=Clostridium sp. LP20 TaxID=3418665 RepID=UPI003EE80B55